MSDSDDLVILTPQTSHKGFKGHLLISSERIKKEPGVQIGMVSPSQASVSSSSQPGLSVPVLNSHPRSTPGGALRAQPVAPRQHAPPAGPRLNPVLQNPNLYFRSISSRDQQQQQQQQQQLDAVQQQSQSKNSIGQSSASSSSAAMPGPPQPPPPPPPPGQMSGQPAASFAVNSQGAPRVDQNAPVLLDSRLILSHVSPLENNDSHQVLNQIKYPHDASAIIKCIECCDQFYFRHSYQHHRERQVVSITYNCEICMRKLSFYNKCALFAHVRTHKLGSVDPSKLTICSLPLAKLKNLSEVSLKQLVTQLDQAHTKYQEALKALNACAPSAAGSQQQQLTAAATAAAAAAVPGTSGSSIVPITIDLEEGGGGSDSALSATAIDAGAGEADGAAAAAVASDSAANALGYAAKDSSGGGGGAAAARPTAVVEPAVVQTPGAPSGGGDTSDATAGPSSVVRAPQQKCSVCDGSFDSLAAHLGDSLKECPLCKKFVPDSRCALRAHYRLHLAAPGPCPECGDEVAPPSASPLEREVAMRIHLRTQCLHLQRSRVFICLKCEYPPRAFSAIRQLADHIIHSHTEKFFKCTVCTLAFRHTNQLAAHLDKEHSAQLTGKPAKIFKCPICDLIFNDSNNLGKHLLSHLPHQLFCKSAMAFRCLDSCRQIFLEKKGLKRHLNTCRSTAVTAANLPCLLCEINVSFFSSLTELRSHEETHLSRTAGGWCPNCETEVESGLLEHLKQEERQKQQEQKPSEQPQRKSICHCGQELPDAAAVARHMDRAAHPIATESQLAEPQSGPDTFYKCRDCPARLACTELTEHIFAEHPALCYLCNSAKLTPAHLLACVTSGRMEGLVADDADAAASSSIAAAATASNDDDDASEGAASSTAGSASASASTAAAPAAGGGGSSGGGVQFCPLCLDAVDGAADLQRHTLQRHGGRSAGFKRPAERDQQKLEAVKLARTATAAGDSDAAAAPVSAPAAAPAAAASSGSLSCGVCGLQFLTKSALQVHRVATRHDS